MSMQNLKNKNFQPYNYKASKEKYTISPLDILKMYNCHLVVIKFISVVSVLMNTKWIFDFLPDFPLLRMMCFQNFRISPYLAYTLVGVLLNYI
jgi:hypothetical protein